MKKQQISKNTALYISIAERPGNFGTFLFNAAFKELGIDAVYKAFKVSPGSNNLENAIKGIRALGIGGCGVTMPFKPQVIKYLDGIDRLALEIGAVNTIVNKNGYLKGYNTDCYGAISVLSKIPGLKNKKIVILGAGGVAQAISCALKNLKANPKNVIVVNKDKKQGLKTAKKWGFKFMDWEERNKIKADVFINATPIGMAPNTDLPINEGAINNFKIIMDVVVDPLETRFIKLSKKKGKKVIMGYQMSLGQAIKQFELYIGKRAPVKVMEKNIFRLKK